jgi:NAD(P)-dependent dehydrogenase (short-subunit alcohol dehydrogenase family)
MTEGKLSGKTAIVTGAAQGAGLGVATALAAEGANVALLGRTLAKLDAAAATFDPSRVLSVQCDVGDAAQSEAAVAAVAERWGGVDILVNAAQHTGRRARLLDLAYDDLDALWRTGPVASLRLMRLCHGYLRGGGSVINFGSGAQFTPADFGGYAATKEAIRTLTRAAAVEWGPDGIRANMIVPHVVSPSMESDLRSRGQYDSLVENLIERIPLSRLGQPVDIGRAAVFLAGPDSDFITGQVLMVDGGLVYHR